jgi:magnesium-transporting ATPase (P-type)
VNGMSMAVLTVIVYASAIKMEHYDVDPNPG